MIERVDDQVVCGEKTKHKTKIFINEPKTTKSTKEVLFVKELKRAKNNFGTKVSFK